MSGKYQRFTRHSGTCPQAGVTRANCTEEQGKQPTAKPFTAWADAWKAMEPTISAAEKGVLSELDDLRKMERCDALHAVSHAHLCAGRPRTWVPSSAGRYWSKRNALMTSQLTRRLICIQSSLRKSKMRLREVCEPYLSSAVWTAMHAAPHAPSCMIMLSSIESLQWCR